MFDIGWSELLIIAVVAIIVVGPKDLPRMLRGLGKYAGQMRRTAGEFRAQFDEAIRESELDDIRKAANEISSMNPVGQIKDSVSESLDPLKKSAEDIRKDVERKETPAVAAPPPEAPKSAPAVPSAVPAARKTRKPRAKAAAKATGTDS
ncbi:MAG: Sec-independent protein translocase protein TatB [Pseudomonadota bacterium]|nr:Sec-independent protein translocase protein TatB [Pseudomonadota bacterium]